LRESLANGRQKNNVCVMREETDRQIVEAMIRSLIGNKLQNRMFNWLIGRASRKPATKVEFFYDRFPGAGAAYDSSLATMSYLEPEILLEEILASGVTRFAHVLEIGCGTGLLGVLLRPMVKTLVCIDGSEKMINEARAKKIYDRLMVGDFLACEIGARQFDLVAASGVFVFFRDLTAPLRIVRDIGREGALVAFTTDAADSGCNPVPEPSPLSDASGAGLMFIHSEKEIRRSCEICDLDVISMRSAVGRRRPGTSEPVTCYFVVARISRSITGIGRAR
jgi:predicted TPR repeat methyltransferase